MPEGLLGLGRAVPRSGRLVVGGGVDGDASAMRYGAGAPYAEEWRPLFRASEREPLYLPVLCAFTGMLDWLAVELAVSVRLLIAQL